MKGVIILLQCSICGNQDENYFGIRNNEIYCRKCIKFSKTNYLFDPSKKINKDINVNLKYPLSSFQNDISNKLLDCFKEMLDNITTLSNKTVELEDQKKELQKQMKLFQLKKA